MKKFIATGLVAGLFASVIVSCNDSSASTKPEVVNGKKEEAASVKKDSAAIGSIKTVNYEMKLHRAFVYAPASVEMLAGFTPKAGFKFMYLDVSMKNTGTAVLDGGEIFIALKITGSDNKEYKKPAAALAAYTSENPGASNPAEYNALWEKFEANEFHRELIYAVEVPADMKAFTLSIPVDRQRKEWKELKFSL
jgi:hypothetical protein